MTTISDPAVPSPLTRDVIVWAQGLGAETLEEARDLYENHDAGELEDVLGIEEVDCLLVGAELDRLAALLGGDLALDDLV